MGGGLQVVITTENTAFCSDYPWRYFCYHWCGPRCIKASFCRWFSCCLYRSVAVRITSRHCCYFIGDLKKIVTCNVHVPVEELHARHPVEVEAHGKGNASAIDPRDGASFVSTEILQNSSSTQNLIQTSRVQNTILQRFSLSPRSQPI